MRLGSVVGMLILVLAVGQARAYCPKRFADSAPGVEQTIWQPGAGNLVRVAFSDSLDAATLGAIEAAFQAWADVECSTLAFEFLDDQAELFALAETNYSAPSASQAEIYVFWVDGEDEPINFVGGFDDAIGHTFPRHDGAGELTSASIAINARGKFPFKVLEVDEEQFFDVQTVVLQLLGEVIGLTSSDLTTGTVMKGAPILTGIGERAPLEDDRSAMQFLYWDDTCSADKRPPDPGAEQFCYPAAADAGTGGSDAGAGAGLDGSTDAPASCTETDRCAAGEICSEGECVIASEDDGCSCATKGHPARAVWGVLALLALLALALAGRARRKS